MKLEPRIKQEYYDENRDRFDGETTISTEDFKKCEHYLKRVTATTVECTHCHNGWIDMGDWEVKKGKVEN